MQAHAGNIVVTPAEAKRRFLAPYRAACAQNRERGWVQTFGKELEQVLVRPASNTWGYEYVTLGSMLYQFLCRCMPWLAQHIGYEFWDGQFEVKAGPCSSSDELAEVLTEHLRHVQRVARMMGWRIVNIEYLPEDGPPVPPIISSLQPGYAIYRDEFPHRAERMYRVASGQYALGCGHLEEALEGAGRIHAAFMRGEFNGWYDQRRFDAFTLGAEDEAICPRWMPESFPATPDEFWAYANDLNFAHNPGVDYGAIRIHAQFGIIEVRFPGPTSDPNVTQRRAQRLHDIVWG